MTQRNEQRGFALVSALLLLALLMALALAHFTLTVIELSATKSSMDSARGFYAAEAGLNLRADEIRETFLGYNRPAGTSPNESAGYTPCATGNDGGGDYRCITHTLLNRSIVTYVKEPGGNPASIVIPRGEPYQNLSAQEYRYETFSVASNTRGDEEAILEMHFKSRLVPMFQFAAFYNKDLEILPGPSMMLAGPVHANGDLYLGTDNTLDINGQVTTARTLYRGRKNTNTCMTGAVRVYNPTSPATLPACSGTRRAYTNGELAPWNGMVRKGLDPLTVPGPEELEPQPGNVYWDKADLRILLDVNGATPAIQVMAANRSVDSSATATLSGCTGAAGTSNSFYNNRETKTIRMLDVDVQKLLDCAHAGNLMAAGKSLDDTTEGGLVLYLGIDGPASAGINGYGVRVRNGAELRSTVAGAPALRGLTVVTDQAIYIQGNYNATNRKPAAFLGDSLNVLSNAWSDANSTQPLTSRTASNTTIHAAFLAGTDSTGSAEGASGQNDPYNGGLENFPRFHEGWSGRTLTYRGSFVSLNTPRHVNGAWVYGAPQYTAPTRSWSYETDFNDAAKLPPLTPRFVYLKQELFVRKF